MSILGLFSAEVRVATAGEPYEMQPGASGCFQVGSWAAAWADRVIPGPGFSFS